ncbi:MAG: VCBS repeat-containing protein, partial [Candidatus Kerfeldbacteria bacterium]|nr:VCBS repeat-containing protein [Candidatus Kerfeldbacteria bacterium]
TLEDGFSLTLGANAAGTEGNGTLTITPASGMARTNMTKPLWYGYDISITNTSDGTPITELASAAQITMPYTDEILEQQGFSESDLTGMTYDDAFGSWSSADYVQIDTVNKVILITVSHFSSFSVMSNGGTTSTSTGTTADNNLYLTGRTSAGPNVRVVDETGEQIETFMAYSPTLRGTWKAVGGDVDGDGLRDVMTAAGTSHGSHVRAFMGDGTLIDDFFAYDAGFRGGVNVVMADVDGDGRDDIVTAPELGTSDLRVYTYNTTDEAFELLAQTMVYDAGYRGGMSLVAADVDGNGVDEVVTGPSMGSGNVRVFSYNATDETLDLEGWTMAYDASFHGGVNLAAGDVDGDGSDEIVAAPAVGASNVRVLKLSGDTFSTVAWFFAYDTGYKNGTQLAVANLDGVAGDEVVTAPTLGTSNVRSYTYDSANAEMDLLDWGFSYGQEYKNGVNLVATDMDGDSKAELAVAPREGTPNVRIYEWESDSRTLVDWFWGFAQTFTGGVNLGF